MHTEIVLLANGYMEVATWDMWRPPMLRHWIFRRIVDYSRICMQ